MSCLGNCYIPNPPREWYRVQNLCTYNNDGITTSNYATIPSINETVPVSSLYYSLALINKGNVLQYKKNSSQLNKQQVYSKIVRQAWTNRTTTWATQSDKYTNPNTTHLKRIGGEWSNGIPGQSPYCEGPYNGINYTLPSIELLPNNNPVIPPPPPVIIPLDNNVPTVPPAPIDAIPSILDFGKLICNATEDPCTGEVLIQPANSNWHPTTDSDVPGRIIDLYWNPKVQTWFPRQRVVMNTSASKWPQGSKFIGTANTLCITPRII